MAKIKRCGLLGCDEAIIGYGEYCSTRCKRQAHNLSTTNKVDTIVHTPVDGKVYNRQAVECSQFDTRPEPLDPTDKPVKDSRGRYTRQDGTVYQFDSAGRAFECDEEYIDKNGDTRLRTNSRYHAKPADPDYLGTYHPLEISNV